MGEKGLDCGHETLFGACAQRKILKKGELRIKRGLIERLGVSEAYSSFPTI